MGKLIFFTSLIIAVFPCSTVQSQELSDEQAIIKVLRGENIDGQFTWRPKDKKLKSLAYEIMIDRRTILTDGGLKLIVTVLTGDEYDDYYDSLFVNFAILKLEVNSLFENSAFFRNHFIRSNYNASSLEKFSKYSKPQHILYWDSWTPYFLSFLEIKGVSSTLIYFKDNIDAINQLHFTLYGVPYRYDTTEINVCLARLGVLNDTIIVNQLKKKFQLDHASACQKYIESLARIRTQYSFQMIGEVLFTELEHIKTNKQRIYIKQMALAAFLAYVKNFPDRSTKWQDIFDMWAMVRYSKVHGTDYSTTEYLEMAKTWYLENANNLVLDYNKY